MVPNFPIRSRLPPLKVVPPAGYILQIIYRIYKRFTQSLSSAPFSTREIYRWLVQVNGPPLPLEGGSALTSAGHDPRPFYRFPCTGPLLPLMASRRDGCRSGRACHGSGQRCSHHLSPCNSCFRIRILCMITSTVTLWYPVIITAQMFPGSTFPGSTCASVSARSSSSPAWSA